MKIPKNVFWIFISISFRMIQNGGSCINTFFMRQPQLENTSNSLPLNLSKESPDVFVCRFLNVCTFCACICLTFQIGRLQSSVECFKYIKKQKIRTITRLDISLSHCIYWDRKEVIEKSRECYNHKPQPTPDNKRKSKWTEIDRCKINKQMHKKHTDQLSLRQARWPSNLSRTTSKHKMTSEDSDQPEEVWVLATHKENSEDSDQTGWMPRLIWVFGGCTVIGNNNRYSHGIDR